MSENMVGQDITFDKEWLRKTQDNANPAWTKAMRHVQLAEEGALAAEGT